MRQLIKKKGEQLTGAHRQLAPPKRLIQRERQREDNRE